MFRYTIRDLLWLMVVVTLGVAWWVDRSRLAEVTNLVDAIRAFRHNETGDYPPNPPASSQNSPSD